MNYSRFTGPKAWQALVWQEITAAIQGYLPGITQKQVQAKWRNLKHSYVRYEENKRTTGKGAKKPPPHYNELSFLRGRVLIQPLCLEEEGLDDDDDDPPSFTKSSPVVLTSVQHSDTASISPATSRVSTAATPMVFPASSTTVSRSVDPVAPSVAPTVSPGMDSLTTATVSTTPTPAVSLADSGHARNITESHAPPPPPLRTRRRTRPPTVRESLDKTIKKLTDKIDSFIDFETKLELRREEREKEIHELDRILKREQIRILQLKRREMERALEEQ
ncbi:uncharacterized protein LOC143031203 isoform X2 [Oratosquilla oratoria]